jgi:hypothetical protein
MLQRLTVIDICAVVIMCVVCTFMDRIPTQHIKWPIGPLVWTFLVIAVSCPPCTGSPYVMWTFAAMTAMVSIGISRIQKAAKN